MLLLQKIASRN